MPSALSELNVTELLQRCAARPVDEAAWQEFIFRYHGTIRAFVTRTFNQRVYADPTLKGQSPDGILEDLVQGVYVKLINDDAGALTRFEGAHENSIHQYLGIIAINVVRDHFRRNRPRRTVSLDQLLEEGDHALVREGIDNVAAPDSVDRRVAVAQDEIEELLRRVIKGRNRDRDILIFKLRFFEELTPTEISKVVPLPSRQISSIIRRVLLRIRPLLARKYHIKLKEEDDKEEDDKAEDES
jgi:RNA polymerase sigma factor (sigma-70 family)